MTILTVNLNKSYWELREKSKEKEYDGQNNRNTKKSL